MESRGRNRVAAEKWRSAGFGLCTRRKWSESGCWHGHVSRDDARREEFKPMRQAGVCQAKQTVTGRKRQ